MYVWYIYIFMSIDLYHITMEHIVHSVCYSRHPIAVIISCVVFAGVCVIPYFVDFKEEKDDLELWTPKNSDFYKNAKWLSTNFPSRFRPNGLVVTTDDETILTRDGLKILLKIHNSISLINTSKNNVTWEKMCIPQMSPYGLVCLENSLLEVWTNGGSYKNTLSNLESVNDAAIIDKINSKNLRSGISGKEINVNLLIGGITKKNNKIETAKALKMSFPGLLDEKDIAKSRELAKEFEQAYLDFLGNYSLALESTKFKIYYTAARSFPDVAKEMIGGDLKLLTSGFVVVFIYVMVMLGNFNSVEQRAYLSLMGISAIGLGAATSYGFCQLIGLVYGPMHSILPFMLLGIGIDDMFVIVQGLRNVDKEKEGSGYSIILLIARYPKYKGVKN